MDDGVDPDGRRTAPHRCRRPRRPTLGRVAVVDRGDLRHLRCGRPDHPGLRPGRGRQPPAQHGDDVAGDDLGAGLRRDGRLLRHRRLRGQPPGDRRHLRHLDAAVVVERAGPGHVLRAREHGVAVTRRRDHQGLQHRDHRAGPDPRRTVGGDGDRRRRDHGDQRGAHARRAAASGAAAPATTGDGRAQADEGGRAVPDDRHVERALPPERHDHHRRHRRQHAGRLVLGGRGLPRFTPRHPDARAVRRVPRARRAARRRRRSTRSTRCAAAPA